MSDLDNELPLPDELTTLKERADLMGINYHPSIGVEKLRDKINAHLNDKPAEPEPAKDEAPQAPVAAEETPSQFRARRRREASELVRIRVTCMNPAKREWDGEIFTAGNSLVGSFSKYVPFNVDEGWHVPRIIYNMLVERMCQIFVTSKTKNGVSVRQGKLIREFAIEVLPQLTQEELDELARRQAMAKSID